MLEGRGGAMIGAGPGKTMLREGGARTGVALGEGVASIWGRGLKRGGSRIPEAPGEEGKQLCLEEGAWPVKGRCLHRGRSQDGAVLKRGGVRIRGGAWRRGQANELGEGAGL